MVEGTCLIPLRVGSQGVFLGASPLTFWALETLLESQPPLAPRHGPCSCAVSPGSDAPEPSPGAPPSSWEPLQPLLGVLCLRGPGHRSALLRRLLPRAGVPCMGPGSVAPSALGSRGGEMALNKLDSLPPFTTVSTTVASAASSVGHRAPGPLPTLLSTSRQSSRWCWGNRVEGSSRWCERGSGVVTWDQGLQTSSPASRFPSPSAESSGTKPRVSLWAAVPTCL